MSENFDTKELQNSLNELKDLMNNIFNRFKKVFWIEISETTNETRDELKNLEDELFKKTNDEIKKELEDIEWNMEKSNTILWKLVKQIPEVKEWIKWVFEKKDWEYLIEENVRKTEVESFLLILKEKSNNDTDSSKQDLSTEDINYIKNYTIEKNNICKKVLEDNRFENLQEKYKTKQKVLEVYNELLKDKWDYKDVTVDLIISKLEQENNN